MGCPAGTTGQPGQAPRAQRAPARRPASFFGVPLCICQRAGTFTPRGGAPHGRQESNLQPLVLETSGLPSLATAIYDANKNRPPGVSPASGFWSVLAPLSRSHPGDQGSTRQQGRGYADIPLVPLALVT